MGGCERFLLRALQIIQNKAASCVTKLSWFTPTRRLLSQYGWLSIKQLVVYHTVLRHKTLRSYKSLYLSDNLNRNFPYPKRQATGGCICYSDSQISETLLTERSFLSRGIKDYNKIPADIKSI